MLMITGCEKKASPDFNLTLDNHLPVQITQIAIENEHNEEILFAQDIPMGGKTEFTLDGNLDKIVLIITPKDMFSTPIELDLNNLDSYIIEYEIALERNMINLIPLKSGI